MIGLDNKQQGSYPFCECIHEDLGNSGRRHYRKRFDSV